MQVHIYRPFPICMFILYHFGLPASSLLASTYAYIMRLYSILLPSITLVLNFSFFLAHYNLHIHAHFSW